MQVDFEWIQKLIIDTPFWVYGILIYLLVVGIVLSRDRVIPFKRLYRLPILFAAISFGDLIKLNGHTAEIAICWALAALLGLTFSWWNVNRFGVAIDKENQLIKMPGSWTNLCFLLVAFATKYYSGYLLLVDPEQLAALLVQVRIAAGLGLCTGFFTAILLYGYYHMRQSTTAISLK